jgi:hypothetical protein
VDRLTWKDYEADLECNLEDLHARVQRGAYRALPSRRVYIPKPDGRQRPRPTSRVRSSSATAPRLPDAGRQRLCRSGQTRDLPASDAILLHVMWP